MAKLIETVQLIERRKKWNQKQFSEAIGLDPSIRSQMNGRTWELHWQYSLKIVALCKELGINPMEELAREKK